VVAKDDVYMGEGSEIVFTCVIASMRGQIHRDVHTLCVCVCVCVCVYAMS
jgi:hypothetical protein